MFMAVAWDPNNRKSLVTSQFLRREAPNNDAIPSGVPSFSLGTYQGVIRWSGCGFVWNELVHHNFPVRNSAFRVAYWLISLCLAVPTFFYLRFLWRRKRRAAIYDDGDAEPAA